jgi:hypothetical protein
LVDDPATLRRQQATVYPLLLPMALIGIAVWILQEPALTVLGYIFAAYSALLLGALPKDITGFGQYPGQWLAALALFAAALAAWALGVPAGWLVLVFLLGLLLRLWYIRQYHRQQGRSQAGELLRRALLIALWSSISVVVALYNPY